MFALIMYEKWESSVPQYFSGNLPSSRLVYQTSIDSQGD